MKLLCAARMASYDLLRAVQGLASRVTKWSSECDKSLHRLMCYVNSTLDVKLRFYIGDPVDQCKFWLFADADHAGEHDNKEHARDIPSSSRTQHLLPVVCLQQETNIDKHQFHRSGSCLCQHCIAHCWTSSAIWSLLQKAGGRYSPTFCT